MAIPTSGQMSMLKMAREAKHGDYNGSQSMGVISLYDMVNGGNTHGSTVSYPTVNDDCTPNPISHDGYHQITLTAATTPGYNVTVFTTRSPINGLVTNDVLYTYASGSYTAWTGASQTHSYWIWSQGTFFGVIQSLCPNISVNSSGVVTTNGSQCP